MVQATRETADTMVEEEVGMLLPVGGRRHRRRQEGFTLIELGVVLAIIAILVAIAVPTYSNMTKRAHDAEAAQAWDMVKAEVWAYYLQNNQFPPNAPDSNWPDTSVIDMPSSADSYWIYSATPATGSFTFTATETKGNRTISWQINTNGSVSGPTYGTKTP